MYRPNPIGLLDIAQILEKKHFSDRSRSRPGTAHPSSRQGIIAARYTSSSNSSTAQFPRQGQRVSFLPDLPRQHQESLDNRPMSMSELGRILTVSRFGLNDKPLDARSRLIQAKKARAQSIRDESLRNRIERRARLTEEQEMRAMRTRSRMDSWDYEKRQREAASMRLQKQRQASEMIRKEEEKLMARVQQQAELEKLNSLKERMKDMEAKKLQLPSMTFNFESIQAPGETFGQMIFRLEMLKKQRDEQLEAERDKNRLALIQKVQREEREKKRRPFASVPPTTRLLGKRHPIGGRPNVDREFMTEARAEEIVRLTREAQHLLSKKDKN